MSPVACVARARAMSFYGARRAILFAPPSSILLLRYRFTPDCLMRVHVATRARRAAVLLLSGVIIERYT